MGAGQHRLPYLLAIDTTNRRLVSTSSCLPIPASNCPFLITAKLRLSSLGDAKNSSSLSRSSFSIFLSFDLTFLDSSSRSGDF